MIVEYIVLTIFIFSFCGALFILTRKVPVLNSLPQNGTTGLRKNRVILNIEGSVKNFTAFFEKQIYLHKILSWVKVLTLKIETRVDISLRKIRSKAQKMDRNLKVKK